MPCQTVESNQSRAENQPSHFKSRSIMRMLTNGEQDL